MMEASRRAGGLPSAAREITWKANQHHGSFEREPAAHGDRTPLSITIPAHGDEDNLSVSSRGDDGSLLSRHTYCAAGAARARRNHVGLHELDHQYRYDIEWVLDEEAPACMCCGTPFNLFLRKHHCRGCGWVVCARCCRARALVLGLRGQQKVGDTCIKRAQAEPALEEEEEQQQQHQHEEEGQVVDNKENRPAGFHEPNPPKAEPEPHPRAAAHALLAGVPPNTSHRAGSVLSPAVTSPARRPRSFYAAMRASPPRPRPAAAADAEALREMVDDVMQHLPPTPSQGGAGASGAAAAAGVGEPAGAREGSAAGPQGGKEAKDENRSLARRKRTGSYMLVATAAATVLTIGGMLLLRPRLRR